MQLPDNIIAHIEFNGQATWKELLGKLDQQRTSREGIGTNRYEEPTSDHFLPLIKQKIETKFSNSSHKPSISGRDSYRDSDRSHGNGSKTTYSRDSSQNNYRRDSSRKTATLKQKTLV